MVMLMRTKVHLTLLLLSRSYEKIQVVMEYGDLQDGCIKSEAKCRLFSESYYWTISVSLREQSHTSNIQSSLLCQISSFLNERKNFFIETELPGTFPLFSFSRIDNRVS